MIVERKESEAMGLAAWYVLRINHSFERKEEDEDGTYYREERLLSDAGFDVYCPRIKVVSFVPKRKLTATKRHSREANEVLRPLYRGYAFVRPVDNSHSVYDVCERRSVLGLVIFGKERRLAKVSNQDIEVIKETIEAGYLNEYHGVAKKHSFKVGQSVKNKGGAFDGIPAVVDDVDKKDEITLLMNLFGRETRVIRSPSEIEALDESVTLSAAHA